MTETFHCPRGPGPGTPYKAPFDGVATWREDGRCSYCGSIKPERLFECIEAGAEITPTDKNYKIYVDSTEAAPLTMTYRNCPKDATCTGPNDCTHWVTEPTSRGKFYFQHLDEAGMNRFIEMLNAKRMKFAYPGYFYVPPFFIRFGPAAQA